MITLRNPNNNLREPNEWVGLSTDDKPTPADYPVRNGDSFYEMDNQVTYWYDATFDTWLNETGIPDFGSDVGLAKVGNAKCAESIV